MLSTIACCIVLPSLNLNSLFFESGEVKTTNELASSFIDTTAVEKFAEIFENCFVKISNELNEIYNEDGTNKHPEIFSLDKTKDEVFAQGFLLWCDNLTEELFQMNNEVDRNKSNGVVFKTLLFAIAYVLFVSLINLAFHFFPVISTIVFIIMVLCYSYWFVSEVWDDKN